jgi:hypothetical protein
MEGWFFLKNYFTNTNTKTNNLFKKSTIIKKFNLVAIISRAGKLSEDSHESYYLKFSV